MLRSTKIKAGLAGLAVTGGAAAAVAFGPMGSALGQASVPLQAGIHVNSPATVIAKGAGADVSVTIQCSGAGIAGVSVSLTERVGTDIATGFGSTETACVNQTVVVPVTAQAGKSFRKGTAIAIGTVQDCAVFSCAAAQDQETITVK
jgi:hypothetical protein